MQVKEDSVSRQSVKVDSATGGIIFPLPWTSYELMQATREFILSISQKLVQIFMFLPATVLTAFALYLVQWY